MAMWLRMFRRGKLKTTFVLFCFGLLWLVITSKPKSNAEIRSRANVQSNVQAIFKQGQIGNYEPKPILKPFTGVVSVRSATPDEKSIAKYGCDMTVSDQISLDRPVRDTRSDECVYWHYASNLPSASVVIVFYNEGNSTLLRTVHSVINRSPTTLLAEVVLVDDGSTLDHLKAPLDKYIKRFNGKVKLYRNRNRKGLIGSRIRGAELATGDVIVVLDAHCECNVNWLPPLLQRIALNRKTMALPIVDMIDYQSYDYMGLGFLETSKGAFDWGLLYKQIPISREEAKRKGHKSEPHMSPTHAGGLFAMDRKYFHEIGAYDKNLMMWGGENFQLSFKIWMCGGQIEWVPCSRVGHIYHTHLPYSIHTKETAHLGISPDKYNYIRVAEGWMDEYKENYYIREPELRHYHVNVTDQLELRKKLGCKSFKWYLETVAKDVLLYFPKLYPNKEWGRLQVRGTQRCMISGGYLKTTECSGHTFQKFRRNTVGQLASGEHCVGHPRQRNKLSFEACHGPDNEPWIWNEDTHQIRHPSKHLCMDATHTSNAIVILSECDPTNKNQKWVFEKH